MRNRTLSILLATAVAALGVAAPAGAHSGVKKRTPAPGSVVSGPKTVKVVFHSGMVTGLITVSRNGSALNPATSGMTKGNRVLRARFGKRLPSGSYSVSWRARATDGHSQSGSWSFRVR